MTTRQKVLNVAIIWAKVLWSWHSYNLKWFSCAQSYFIATVGNKIPVLMFDEKIQILDCSQVFDTNRLWCQCGWSIRIWTFHSYTFYNSCNFHQVILLYQLDWNKQKSLGKPAKKKTVDIMNLALKEGGVWITIWNNFEIVKRGRGAKIKRNLYTVEN